MLVIYSKSKSYFNDKSSCLLNALNNNKECLSLINEFYLLSLLDSLEIVPRFVLFRKLKNNEEFRNVENKRQQISTVICTRSSGLREKNVILQHSNII